MTVEFHHQSLQNALGEKEENFYAAESDKTAQVKVKVMQEDKQENLTELVSQQDQISMEMIEEKVEISDSSVFAQPHVGMADHNSDQQQISQISNTGVTSQDQMGDPNSQDQSFQQQQDQTFQTQQTQDQNSYQSQNDTVKQEISNQEEGVSMALVQEPSQQEGISMEMVEPGVETIDPVLVKEQFNWLKATLRVLKKKKDAHIFLVPVNPVALNIPTYFTIIKEPMDISTVEQKISHGQYQTVDEALADLKLMFNNCYTFNGELSPISAMGKNCEAWLQKEVLKMPRTRNDILMKQKKIPKSLDINGFGRNSPQENGKRRLTSGRVSGDLKFCSYIHKELMKKVNHPIVWAFKEPVDPVALGIPTYFDIIKHPMDLSTVKKKLDSGEYETAEEFESDIRLIISNCFTFNAPGSDVHNLGLQFEAFFDLKWSEKTNFLNQHGDITMGRQKSISYSESEDDDDDEDAKHISMLKSQLNLLNQQLKMLQDKQARKKDKRRTSRLNSLSAGQLPATTGLPYVKPAKKNSIPGVGNKRGRKKRVHESDDEKMPETDITYEQKRELSDSINILPADKLPQVFEIIKENANLNAVEDEEIELDIDSLDKPVLWKLYLFVKKHTRPPKKPKIDDQGDATIVGPVSSSSESDDGDSDVPKPGSRKPKIAILAGPSKPTFRKSKTSKPITPAPPALKKPATTSTIPLPFRTEKGEVTNYTSNFKVSQKPAEEKKPAKQAKPAPPPKPAYDSFLDLAWERLDTIKSKPAEEVKPEKPKPSAPVPEKPTFARSPSPEEEYTEPLEWLDLQGQSDLIKDTVDTLGDEDEIEELRKETYAVAKSQLDSMLPDDVLLNNEYPVESEEEGELS